MTTVAWVRGIGRLSAAELHALDLAATAIGTPVDALAAVIAFETGGTFDPAVVNHAGSGATGLIQFMAATAKSLGTTTAALAAMTFTEQLEYVVKYFRWFKTKLDTLEKLYCAVFWPAAIDKPDDYVVGTVGSAVYRQNAGFDLSGNKDGKITRAEICAAVRKVLEAAASKPRIEIPEIDGSSVPFTDDEKRAILNLVDKTSSEATEEFRRGSPIPIPDDEEPPPTKPNA